MRRDLLLGRGAVGWLEWWCRRSAGGGGWGGRMGLWVSGYSEEGVLMRSGIVSRLKLSGQEGMGPKYSQSNGQ